MNPLQSMRYVVFKRLALIILCLIASVFLLRSISALSTAQSQAHERKKINGKVVADKESPAQRLAFSENGPLGRWSGSIIPDLSRNSSNSPDGYGWCCTAEGCGGYASLAQPPDKDLASNIINPSCCDDWQRLQCYQGGGEWYESQCACYSPLVIDVAGNGFNLTNAVNGVMFATRSRSRGTTLLDVGKFR